jgi:hypothetical protein
MVDESARPTPPLPSLTEAAVPALLLSVLSSPVVQVPPRLLSPPPVQPGLGWRACRGWWGSGGPWGALWPGPSWPSRSPSKVWAGLGPAARPPGLAIEDATAWEGRTGWRDAGALDSPTCAAPEPPLAPPSAAPTGTHTQVLARADHCHWSTTG